MVLALDLIVFFQLIVILVTGSRDGRCRYRTLKRGAGAGEEPDDRVDHAGASGRRPGWAVPGPVNEFLGILGAAATPGALFAIGASLAGQIGRAAVGRGLAERSASWCCTRRRSPSRRCCCFPVDPSTRR
jgi:hypothetical protein